MSKNSSQVRCDSNSSSDGSPPPKFDDALERKLQRSDRILSGLSGDQKTGVFCDVILQVDGEEFPVHKSVFKACSVYFEAMFTGSFDESSRDKILISDVSKEAFQLIVDFVYGRRVDLNLDNIFSVCATAEMMCLDDLVLECKEKTKQIFWSLFPAEDVDEFLGQSAKVIYIAEHLVMKDFCTRAIERVKVEVEKASNRLEVLLSMTPTLFLPMLEIASKWDPGKEAEKVQFLRCWIKRDPEDRLVHWKRILHSINLELLPSELAEKFCGDLDSLLKKHLGCEERVNFDAQFKNAVERLPYITDVALFAQNPKTKQGDLRLLRESTNGEYVWVCKSLDLHCEIVESVKVQNRMVLFGRDSFYQLMLEGEALDGEPERVKAHVLRPYRHFVACVHKAQVIVAGMTVPSGSERVNTITLMAFHYWKMKPEVVKLFFFRCDGHSCTRPMSVLCNDKSIYVFAHKPNAIDGVRGVLLVNSNRQNATIPIAGLKRTKLLQGKYSSNRLFMQITKKKVYLIDQHDSLFSGVSVNLPEFREESPNKKICCVKHPECKERIYDEIKPGSDDREIPEADKVERTDRHWIGAVKGNLLANCKFVDEHFLLVAQGKQLALFSMKDLRKFQFVRQLPDFDDYAPNLYLPDTNFFLRIFKRENP